MITEVCFEELLLKSTQVVFETMVFMDISDTYDPAIKENAAEECVLGSITFKGTLEGCLSISCNHNCAKTIAANMLGMDVDESISDEDINDAIGEVANMVMGSLKGSLEDSPFTIEVSIPTVIKGNGIERCLRDAFDNTLLDVCLEDTHPINILLQYRVASQSGRN